MRWFDRRWQDMRYSVRMLRRSPGFTVVAVSVLALGVGVNAAVFSVVSAIFFRPLGVTAPEQLVAVYQNNARYREFYTSYFDVTQLREQTAAFSGVTGRRDYTARLTVGGEAENVETERVASNYFDVLGVPMQLGRPLQAADADPASTERAVVISDALWTRRFARDPSVVGKPVRIDDVDFVVVGIAAQGFKGTSVPWSPTDLWATFEQARLLLGLRDDVLTDLAFPIARLKAGVSLEQARAMLATQTPEHRREILDQVGLGKMRVFPYLALPLSAAPVAYDPLGRTIPLKVIYAVTIVVCGVLLIAAANIAGILRARGVARSGELAVRQALGAGAARLASQLLTESVIVAALGGLGGLFIAWAMTRVYAGETPPAYVVPVSIGVEVQLFTAALCVVTGLIVGLAPALQARRVNVNRVLGAGGGATPRTGRRLRHGIVIPQVTLACLLLVLAGVHAHALWGIERMDLGFDVGHRVVADANEAIDRQGVLERAAITDPAARKAANEAEASRSELRFRTLLDRAAALPGVRSAAAARALPVDERSYSRPYISDVRYDAGSTDTVNAAEADASPGYFQTMGIPLTAGREFRDTDTPATAIIISQSIAERLFPHGNAVGARLAYFPDDPTNQARLHPTFRSVIGIVGEVSSVVRPRGSTPMLYVPRRSLDDFLTTHVIVDLPDTAIGSVQALKHALASADPSVEISKVQTMDQIVGQVLYPRRAAAELLSASAVAGLLLAAVGLYGVISYSVAQRLREIGVRATLGATRADIMTMVMREGATVAAIGGAMGFGLSLIALRLTSSLVGTVPTTDVAIFIAVPLVMVLVIGAASLVPARRAARVDPIQVLRAL